MLHEVPQFQNAWVSNPTFPAVNIWEDENSLYAEAELPGVKMEDIEISVVGNELTLKGERKPFAGDDGKYHRRERGVGSFTRVLHLPLDIDAEKVEATLRNGVLLIHLPKAAAALPRKIEVRALPQ